MINKNVSKFYTMMNPHIADIKNHLHQLILETDDESILSKVQSYFATLSTENVDWWDTISKQEKESIKIGLHQLEDGEGIPHETVKMKADKLLEGK